MCVRVEVQQPEACKLREESNAVRSPRRGTESNADSMDGVEAVVAISNADSIDERSHQGLSAESKMGGCRKRRFSRTQWTDRKEVEEVETSSSESKPVAASPEKKVQKLF